MFGYRPERFIIQETNNQLPMKTITSLLCMMFCCIYINAQTNYYTENKIFYEDGYAYQCEVDASGTVTLYNKENKWTHVTEIYKDTGETFVMPDTGIDLTESDTWTDDKCRSIVIEAFTTEQKLRVKGRDVYIIISINTDTGKVDEVNFEFVNFGGYATIPVSVYRKIETEIKKNIWFVLTDEGRKLNYIYQWWAIDPNDLLLKARPLK